MCLHGFDQSGDYIEGGVETAHSAGQTGWCVGVSLLAPFAMITPGERIGYDNGDTVEPALESYLVNIDGSPIDPVAHFQEMVAEEEFSQLMAAQHKIADIVERHGATVLLEEEWKEHVPRLRAGDGVAARDPLHVLDALFFEGV